MLAVSIRVIEPNEAEKAAQKAFVDARRDRDEIEAKIKAAEQRTEWAPEALNAQQVKSFKKHHGQEYPNSAKQVEIAFEKWLQTFWIPRLLRHNRSIFIQSKTPEKREALHEATMWKFLELEWFPALDFKDNPLAQEVVRYYRVKHFAETDGKGKGFLLGTISDILRESM
ncbi:MAG: hypothetical protein Q9204_002165 [Flavoplaca sp. TL-2023a]